MSKIFGTDGIRCLVNKEPLSAETCLKIAKSVAYILRNKNNLSTNFNKKNLKLFVSFYIKKVRLIDNF